MNAQQQSGAVLAPRGAVAFGRTQDLGDLTARHSVNGPSLAWRLRNLLRYRRRELPSAVATRFLGWVPGIIQVRSALALVRFSPDLSRLDLVQRQRLEELLAAQVSPFALASPYGAQVTDFGIVSRRLVTNAGVGFLVDAFQNLVELENMRYHAFGVGVTAEAQGDTALVTELTTEYATDNVRPTGSTTEGAANVFRSVATLSPDGAGTLAITEHMLLSQAATGGGVGLDRSVFAAVNLTRGADSLQATYDFTVTAGG